MAITFYDKNLLAKKFGVSRRNFHREIKTPIVSNFKKELKEKNIKNPDIGLDINDKIYLSCTPIRSLYLQI